MRSPLELAQGLSRVALALHIAGRSAPFGVTRSRILILTNDLGALTQMCPPFRMRPSICSGVIGGMLTQHEVCLDVSVDTTLGYSLPAGCKPAPFLLIA